MFRRNHNECSEGMSRGVVIVRTPSACAPICFWVVSGNICFAGSASCRKDADMTITENTTLKELIEMLGSVSKAGKTPTSKALREEADLLCSGEGCMVFTNGYGIYENGIGRTVLWIPSCISFTYHFDKLKEEEKKDLRETDTLPEGFLESLPWYMALTVVGDHRVEDNVMNRRQGGRKGSKDYKSQDDDDQDDSMVEAMEEAYEKEFFWKEEHVGENPESIFIRKETRAQMLAEMTQKQREVFILYYQQGYTQQEIAEMLHLSRTTVEDRLEGALKKAKKML